MQQQSKTNDSALANNQTGCWKWKLNLKIAEKIEFVPKNYKRKFTTKKIKNGEKVQNKLKKRKCKETCTKTKSQYSYHTNFGRVEFSNSRRLSSIRKG